jgi:hypothetical protein
MRQIRLCFATAFAIVAAASCVGEARAIERLMTDFANAPSICQGALPNFEGALRKRPLAVQNEGAVDAFVTCAWSTETFPVRLHVQAGAIGGQGANLTCTLVSGTEGNDFVRTSTKSIDLPANGLQQEFTWRPEDFGQPTGSEFPNAFLGLTCKLPPATNLGATYLVYKREIGA